MSYGYYVSPPLTSQVGDRTYFTWTITETGLVDDPSAGEGVWCIDEMPTVFTITLFEAAVVDATPAPTLNPRLGLTPGFGAGTVDEVVANLKAVNRVRNACSVRVTSPDNRLYGRSVLGVPGPHTVRTRITVMEGH